MKFKPALFFALALTSAAASAGPSEAECSITTAIDSPIASLIKIPLILTNPAASFVFAANTYRQSLCPRPQLITREEAQAMIAEAVAQVRAAEIKSTEQVECLAGCSKTMTANVDQTTRELK